MAVDLTVIHKLGTFLLDCSCAKLMVTEAGCPVRHCLVPGIEPEAANCCDPGGQLTVNFFRAYPSRDFPLPDLGANNCDAPYTVVTYLITVYRCMPIGDINKAPSCEALNKVALTTMTDAMALRVGVTCCLKNESVVIPLIGEPYKWLLGDHLPTDAEGGCVGTTLTVQVGLPTCWEC